MKMFYEKDTDKDLIKNKKSRFLDMEVKAMPMH